MIAASAELLDTAATLSAVVLAAVLATAAVVKLTALQKAADEFAALGLGRSRHLPAAVALSEIVASLALVLRPTLGAAAAASLLVAFTGVVTWALVAGKQVSCGCFGPLSNEPISSATVARNAVLLALAVLAGTRPGLIVPDLAATVAVTVAALTAVVTVQAAMTAQRLGRLWSVELAGEMSREAIVHNGRSEE